MDRLTDDDLDVIVPDDDPVLAELREAEADLPDLAFKQESRRDER